jgi:AraC-like DNA-binding protein
VYHSVSRILHKSFWEQLNVKCLIGSLQVDIYLDTTFVPNRVDGNLTSHNHSTYELQLIHSGTGTLVVGGCKYEFKPGTLHLIGPNVFHAFEQGEGQSFTRSTLRFSYQSSTAYPPWFPLQEAGQMTAALADVSYVQLDDPDSYRKIAALMDEMVVEIQASAVGAYFNVQSLGSQLIVHLVRSLPAVRKMVEPTSFPRRIQDELRCRIIDMYFGNYYEHLTIEELAEQLNLSDKQTNRVLKRQYGMTFKEKLQHIRIEVSKDLLRTSRLPVQQVAEQVGYKTMSYFRSLFMQYIGVTPEQYRDNLAQV